MESINKKVIFMALIMALITSALVYVYIKRVTTKPEIIEYVNVYVAAKTLPPKHKIINEDIKMVKVTREYLNTRAVLNSADVVGKYLKDSVIEGEQILKDRIVDENKLTLVYNVPEGKRAVSINVNEQIEVANLLKPGDFVDVLASFDKEEVDDKDSKTIYPRITKTIIQNVKVLALGQDQYVADDKAKELPKTVTLAVDPADAEKLVYASEFSVLRLSLRGVGDNRMIDTPGAIRSDIVNEKGVKIISK
ncbi:MAG: Flp pilus assembly protein CpaB [Clostridia bacterium]|nr:Flp pilus assembly protein CpaB [Clostridia bacterium]